jgi:hypothetical protein
VVAKIWYSPTTFAFFAGLAPHEAAVSDSDKLNPKTAVRHLFLFTYENPPCLNAFE